MVRLEKFEKSDYQNLIRWALDEQLTFIFSGGIFSYPITNDQLDEYLNENNRMVFKVIETQYARVIGHAELNQIDHKNKSSRICRVLIGEENYRGKGYGEKIIKELVRIGFEDLKLHRIDLGVHESNKRAIRCYEKCGFKIEGLLRDTMKFRGKYWSAYNMSILNHKL